MLDNDWDSWINKKKKNNNTWSLYSLSIILILMYNILFKNWKEYNKKLNRHELEYNKKLNRHKLPHEFNKVCLALYLIVKQKKCLNLFSWLSFTNDICSSEGLMSVNLTNHLISRYHLWNWVRKIIFEHYFICVLLILFFLSTVYISVVFLFTI